MNKITTKPPFDFLVLTDDGSLVLSIGTSSDRKAVAALVSAVSIMARGIVGSSYVKSDFEGLVITAIRRERYIYALVTPPNIAFSEEDLLDVMVKLYFQAPKSSMRLVIWEVLSEAKMLRTIRGEAFWDCLRENLPLVTNVLMLTILRTPYLLIDTDYYGECASLVKLIREQTTKIAILPSSITRFLSLSNIDSPAVFIGKHGETQENLYKVSSKSTIDIPKTTKLVKRILEIGSSKRRYEKLEEILRKLGIIASVILKEFDENKIVYEDQLREILKNQPKDLVDAAIEAMAILRKDLAKRYITRQKIIEDLI